MGEEEDVFADSSGEDDWFLLDVSHPAVEADVASEVGDFARESQQQSGLARAHFPHYAQELQGATVQGDVL